MSQTQPTKDDVKAALAVVAAVTETIRELGEVPSGHLYARLMGRMSLETYNQIIQTIKNTGLVSETGHVLKWVG
jgi:hypothetical protein